MEIESIKKNSLVPRLPESIKENIVQVPCCYLSDDELALFSFAYKALAGYAKDNPFSAGLVCSVVYLEEENLTLRHVSSDKAHTRSLCLIWMSTLRSRDEEHRRGDYILALLEEPCHALYQIGNEYQVKNLILEIIRPYFLNLTKHRFWPHIFDENDVPILNPRYQDDYDEYVSLK